ncbi:hypothetical protein ACIBSV_46820 [Embleya sp. NPDC050154]|uniref:hypothetical protein n=1 Tax=Embleya sp. NPDC050154 TaxID=3363988 RepID=UPI0037AB19C4
MAAEFRCKCGQPSTGKGRPCSGCACGAKVKNSRGIPDRPATCGQWPVAGGKRCRKHGGNTPQAKAAAWERVIEAEVRTACGRLDIRPIDDPLTALLEHAGVVSAWESHIRLEMLALPEYVYNGGAHLGEQERALVRVWERASDAKTKVLAACARLGIADRLAAISEAQAERLLSALEAALAAAGVSDPDALNQARMAAGRHLAVVAS